MLTLKGEAVYDAATGIGPLLPCLAGPSLRRWRRQPASAMGSPNAASSGSSPDTVIPKSYAKGIAMTPDPWEACARLEYGSDRSLAWSVNQQVVQTAPSGRAKIEERILALLVRKDCTAAGRAFLCRMLVLVGTEKSVPTLAPLLRDPKTTESARYALEAIPGIQADAALREALGSLRGDAKAGTIGSIAARGDSSARPLLAALKDNPAEPPVVRDAASRALDCLGGS